MNLYNTTEVSNKSVSPKHNLNQNWSKLSYVGPFEDENTKYALSNANGANGRC